MTRNANGRFRRTVSPLIGAICCISLVTGLAPASASATSTVLPGIVLPQTSDDKQREVNAILDEIEGPIKEIVPLVQASAKQAKSTIKKADGVLTQVSTLPAEVTKAIGTLGDLANRLAPLTQFAETAGAMFGIKPSGN